MKTDGFSEARLDRERVALPHRTVAKLAQCGPERSWDDTLRSTLERSITEARSLITPRARWLKIPSAGSLFDKNADPTPVERIVREGKERWAFIVTIGTALEERVKEHFARSEYLEAVLLDASGSIAVEGVADHVEAACTKEEESARFSPGYCAWHLSNQKALFALLEPEALDIALLPSMLMAPLKSVSGVVVRAEQDALRVPRKICEQCDAVGCTRRQGKRPGFEKQVHETGRDS